MDTEREFRMAVNFIQFLMGAMFRFVNRETNPMQSTEALDIDKVIVEIVIILLLAQLLIPLFLLFTVYVLQYHIILVLCPPMSFQRKQKRPAGVH